MATKSSAQGGQARVRFIHAAPDTNRVRVLIDEKPLFRVGYAFDSGDATNAFVPIPAGNRFIEVRLDDTVSVENLFADVFDFKDGDLVTLALVGHSQGKGNRKLTLIRIDEPRINTQNKAAVTFVHLMMPDIRAPEADRFSVNVWNVSTRVAGRTDLLDTQVEGLQYGEVTEPDFRDPGLVSFTITRPDSKSSLLPVSIPLRISLAANRLYTIFVFGYDGKEKAKAPLLIAYSYRLDGDLRLVDSSSSPTPSPRSQSPRTPTPRGSTGGNTGGSTQPTSAPPPTGAPPPTNPPPPTQNIPPGQLKKTPTG